MCPLIKYHPAICAVRLQLVHRESYLITKHLKKVEILKTMAYPFLWNSKPVALKRESLLNTFADGGLKIVDIITKI